MRFEVNGEFFHGTIGDEDDPNNVRMCGQCQKFFILGTSLCPTLSCTGPITKTVRDDMMVKEAHRVWDMFISNAHVEEWQLKAYLEIDRHHPMNATRRKTDEASATNVAQFIRDKEEIFVRKVHEGWVRPRFAIVPMKKIFEEKRAAGKAIAGIRGQFSEDNGKMRSVWNRARKMKRANGPGYYDGVLDRYDHDLGVMLNGEMVSYADTVKHMSRELCAHYDRWNNQRIMNSGGVDHEKSKCKIGKRHSCPVFRRTSHSAAKPRSHRRSRDWRGKTVN